MRGISEFEKKNDVIVNVLNEEEKKIYILREKKYDCHGQKQNFCMNCLQGFPNEINRDKYFEHC